MLPWSVGVFFILGLIIFIYLVKSIFSTTTAEIKSQKKSETFSLGTLGPKKDDIILAELTEQGINEDYGILWNANPGTYNFSITTSDLDGSPREVASGTTASETNIFKVKGLPLEIGQTYTVRVGETKVTIPFFPPSFDLSSLVVSENLIDCNTTSTPTNIEVIIDGNRKITLSHIQIKIEPPGFIINHPPGSVNTVIMIYNGPNTANILSINGAPSVPGETPVPF